MDLNFNEDHDLLRAQVREFAASEVAPGAEERDRTCEFPRELRDKMAEMGLFGSYVPEQYGGAGMDIHSYAIIVEELSRACASTGVIVSAHTSLCIDPILRFGNEEQKAKYLPKLASGEWIGCMSLTEPGSGSDAGAATCTAVLDDDAHWRINGRKCFVTNGGEADVMVLIAVTAPEAERRRQSAIIVEKPWDGLSIGKLEKKMGISCSSTAEFVFEDCVVPKENLLGEVGKGLNIALATLDGGRIGIAAQSLGIAEACLDASADYANTREQFKQKIGNFAAIQKKLADMRVNIEASRLLIHRAAELKGRGASHGTEAAMAKLFASETAMKSANEAVQTFGGYGYCKDYAVERYFRDAKICEIYEGTSEIHRVVIGRAVTQDPDLVANR